MKNKFEIIFGDKENPKRAYDSKHLIILTGHAIKQVKDGEVHPCFPFKMVDQYSNELSWEFYNKYVNKPDIEKFDYLYFERLALYGLDICGKNIDQLEYMRENLKEQIDSNVISNRAMAITWKPEIDCDHSETPCLQKIQVRYCGNQRVDVQLDWRSRDLFGAWQVNIIGLVRMLYRYVLSPNECEIHRLTDISFSSHIYSYDWANAQNVEILSVNPMFFGR
jgi:thymidylate synthase